MPYAPPFQDCPLSYQEYEKFQQNQIIVVEIQKKPRNFVKRYVISQYLIYPLIYHPPDSGNLCGSHRNVRTFRHFEFYVKYLPRFLRLGSLASATSDALRFWFTNGPCDLGGFWGQVWKRGLREAVTPQRVDDESSSYPDNSPIRCLRGMSSTLTRIFLGIFLKFFLQYFS